MREFGIAGDTPAGRRRFEEVMEQRRFQADGKDDAGFRRGWCVGGEGFRQELLAQVKVRVGPNHFGSERRESAEERARRLIGEALKENGFSINGSVLHSSMFRLPFRP